MTLGADDLRALADLVIAGLLERSRGGAAPRQVQEVRDRLSHCEENLSRWRRLLGSQPPFAEEDRGALAWQLAVDLARRELLRWFLGMPAAEVPFWKDSRRRAKSTWVRPPVPDPPEERGRERRP